MDGFIKITEQESNHHQLESKSVAELLQLMNEEDKLVPLAVEKALPQIEKLVEAIADKMLCGGRLFYIGAGTSGRIGVVDASECPPSFGVPPDMVVGIMAGGDAAMFRAVEFAEDSAENAWMDLEKNNLSEKDVVVGIAASGTTPYTLGALQECRRRGILTGSIACNPMAPISALADFPVEVVVGPEFVTGSTRLKSGTAQKLVLNMISTAVMIQLGRVEDNKMVNMLLSNEKLLDRGIKMLMEKTGGQDYAAARKLLLQFGSVKKALDAATP